MSSLTLKGKPSEQAPLAPVTTSRQLSTQTSNASSGTHLNGSVFTLLFSSSDTMIMEFTLFWQNHSQEKNNLI